MFHNGRGEYFYIDMLCYYILFVAMADVGFFFETGIMVIRVY